MERWLCGCEDLGTGACRGQKGVVIPLKFQWQGLVSCTTVSTLNSCYVSPGPKIPRCLITVKHRKNQHASQNKVFRKCLHNVKLYT